MMPSYLGASLHGMLPPSAPAQTYTNEFLLDDLSRQMAASAATRRHSRGSHGTPQHIGNAMRIVKPSSANNSPRSSIQQRRRTMMQDPMYARRAQQQVMEQQPQQSYLPSSGPEAYVNPTPVRAPRPVSWHPSSSHLSQYQQLPALTTSTMQYSFPTYNDLDYFNNAAQFPPTPAAYSAYGSPSSTFSPLSLPYSGYEAPQQQYYSPGWNVSAAPITNTVPTMSSMQTTAESYAPISTQCDYSTNQSQVDWNNFAAMQSFDHRVTAPPTPEDLPKMQQIEPALPREEAIPYQPLEEDEEEGEILIGMGLYDTPEKDIFDPTLDNYRNRLSMLGASFDYPESKGKGLKLEETWEPPPMDDDDDEEDGDGEADGDEQEDDE